MDLIQQGVLVVFFPELGEPTEIRAYAGLAEALGDFDILTEVAKSFGSGNLKVLNAAGHEVWSERIRSQRNSVGRSR